MLYVNITPKGETEGLLAWWCLLHIGTQLSMVCTEMPDTRSTENVGAGPGAFLVAKDGGRLLSFSKRLSAL